MDEENTVQEEAQQPEKRRRGRKPMSPEEKAVQAEKRKAQKARAESTTPEVVIQYHDIEVNANSLIEVAKAEFRAVKKRTPIINLKLYVKPEEHAVYYVVNETFDGNITL